MFINSIDPANEIEAALPQLGLGYLISSIRKEFGPEQFEFKIVDRAVEKEINAFKPDVIGITSASQNYNRAIEYARIAKKYNLPVIMGGVHISALPSTLTADMDVGVIGEGEQTIVELCKLYLAKGLFDKGELANIKGIIFRKNNELVVTEKRAQIKPLDRIPMPARDMLKIKKSTHMFSSRGCVYKCSFCASCRFWEGIRFFSAEYVVDEIKSLVNKYHVKVISFWDDLFVANRIRLRRILELLKQEDILRRVTFSCNVRSNLVDDELALLLKQMNVKYVGMGMESCSPRTLEYLKGNNISIKDHENAVKILRKYGIRFTASFIIGSPHETREDIMQTLEFIKEKRLNRFTINVLAPYPDTPVWDYAKSRNLVSEEMDWEALNVNFGDNQEKAIILSEQLTKEEICELFSLFTKIKTGKVIKRTLRNPKLLLKGLARLLSGKRLIVR